MTNIENNELQTLLDLDGLVFWPNAKYWVKFNAKYEFRSPTQLLTDFWKAVDQIIGGKD